MARRTLALMAAAVVLALALAAAALGATVTVRVEGKTQPIFGSVPVTVEAPNALVALDLASTLGEFYYALAHTSLGDYVSQIGKYPAAGDAGWAFKVNGVSPPVGAGQATLKDGDEVLWYYAAFGASGGPRTLSLKAAGRNCYLVSSTDDLGVARLAGGALVKVDGRRFTASSTGRACVGRHVGLVRAYAAGAVRSNAVP